MEKFASRFQGLERAFGLSIPTDKVSARGKRETTYKTLRGAIQPAAWKRHLDGLEGLVVTPVRDDGTCWFGAIDVDVYPLDIPALSRQVQALGFPLVTCRTKSGGAHLYLFLTEPAPAEAVQRQLRRWAAALNYGQSEIFPKQHRLAGPNDLGSGINLPYFGDGRKAVDASGEDLPLDEFLAWADKAAVPPSRLGVTEEEPEAPEEEPGAPDVPTELEGAPPCLIQWAKQGVAEGSRNEIMFDFAVYCKKRWGDAGDWRGRFEKMNQDYCDPPLAANELLTILKGVSAKTYTYKSKCAGPYCDPKKCRKQTHGLGGGYTKVGFEVGPVVVIETTPRLAILTINGKNVEFPYEYIREQKLFAKILFEAVEMFHKPLKPQMWEETVAGWFSRAERQDPPEDASPDGQLFQHLDHYRRKYPAKAIEELRIDGRAWYDPTRKRVYVKGRDLLTYLRREKAGNWTPSELFHAIKRLDGGEENLVLQGEKLTVWWVPMEPEVTTTVPVPSGKADNLPF